jgi:U3 small nucleolar RNA-associated protein 25
MLSAFETPESRALFKNSLANVAGKLRTESSYDGSLVRVKRGVKHVLQRFEAGGPDSDDDKRFEFFTTKVGE